MMSLRVIQNLADEQAEQAESEGIWPLFVPHDWCAYTQEQKERFGRRIPNIGSYCPEGMCLAERLFVDKTGSRSPDGPDISFFEYVSRMRPGYGYAIVEEGEFQVYVGVFDRTSGTQQEEG